MLLFSLRTHVSQPYVTVGLIIDQYNFSLYFLDTNLLHSKALPILSKVIIKFTVHCIVHLQCTLSLSLSLCRIYKSKGIWCFILILKGWQSNAKTQDLYCTLSCTFSSDGRTIKIIYKGSMSAQQYSFITIKVSNRQHVSTHQVVIIRSITERCRIVEGCAHVWDPISVYKRAYW